MLTILLSLKTSNSYVLHAEKCHNKQKTPEIYIILRLSVFFYKKMNKLPKISLVKHLFVTSSYQNIRVTGHTRHFCDKIKATEDEKFDVLIPKVSGFAKAYEKQETAVVDEQKASEEPVQSFAAMLRGSKFIDVSHFFAL